MAVITSSTFIFTDSAADFGARLVTIGTDGYGPETSSWMPSRSTT